jgi:MFS family permease
MFTSILPIGGLVGPLVGGAFTAAWSWRAIFLVNVPIGIVLIVLALKFIPNAPTHATNRIDVRGILLLGTLILSAMFAISYLGDRNTPLYNPIFLLLGTLSVVAGRLFLRHSKRHPAPFIPLALLRGRGFAVMNLINLMYGAAALGFGTLLPLYAEDRFHISSLAAGVLLTARAVGMISVAALAVLAMRRTGHRVPMITGSAIVATGIVIMSIAPPGLPPDIWLTAAAVLTGIGMGLSVPASNNASLQLAPEHVAAIAGLRGMFRQSGSIVAVSVTTTVISRSSAAGLAQAHVFLIFAVLLVLTIPLILLVPDHHGSW